MRIPEIRDAMLNMAERLRGVGAGGLAGTIEGWVIELHRRKPVRRAPPSRRLRPDPSTLIRYADAHPDASYMEIAERFGCSIGRVSEALAGYRE